MPSFFFRIKPVNVAIVSIGDELLIGQSANTNATWLASVCTALGARVLTIVTVADDEWKIAETFGRLAVDCTMILCTGGLGPTHDDVTVAALGNFLQVPLVEDQTWRSHLSEYYQARGSTLSERNKKQCLVPSNSAIIHNAYGTAPGIIADFQDCTIVLLPGVPAEMQAMFQDTIKPLIKQKLLHLALPYTRYRTVVTAGIVESTLADLLAPIFPLPNAVQLAFLPSASGVRLRIGVTARSNHDELLDGVEHSIRLYAGKAVIGTDATTLVGVVGNSLMQRGYTISVAESCTGGLLGGTLTSIDGSSGFFLGGIIAYSNSIKIEQLQVEASLIDQVGAVHPSVAVAMAKGVQKKFGTTLGVGVTGIAGPAGGSIEKPVGTVCIAVASKDLFYEKTYHFGAQRIQNQQRSVAAALLLVREFVLDAAL
jgi:nicotinamide-nucleotide amidase